ncbi:MAG: hypothetical protein HYU29_03135 [Chloroflexi bacterium]|nr:hypothetical protein [Chloroflexota bacterium]
MARPCLRPGRLAPRDLYLLRQAQQRAKRLSLRAQLAQQEMEELLLDMERRYGLLGERVTVDISTGLILPDGQREQSNEVSKESSPALRQEER